MLARVNEAFTFTFVRKLTYSFRFIKGTLINMLTCALWSDYFNSFTFVFNMQASIRMAARRNLPTHVNLDLILKSVELSF